jgi:hypothetical protein
MYFSPPNYVLVLSSLVYGISAATVPALPAIKPLLTTEQALISFSKAVALIERKNVAISQTSLNRSIAIAQHITNETLNRTDGLIHFKVSGCPTALDFHDFGAPIPSSIFLQTMTVAIAEAFQFVGAGNGHHDIYMGWFRYQQPFDEGSLVDLAVGDFRELGRPMNYFVLCDMIRGISEFMMLPQYGYHELRFEVEVKGLGYAGSGRIKYTAPVVAVA